MDMQALYKISLKDESIKRLAKKIITQAMNNYKTQSVISRAKKLIKKSRAK